MVAVCLTPSVPRLPTPSLGLALPSSEAGRAGAGTPAGAAPLACPAAKTPPPSAAGRRLWGRQRASRECGGAAPGGGWGGGRQDPSARGFPSFQPLDAAAGGAGSAAARLLPFSAPPPRSASGRSASPVAPLPQGAMLLVGARSTSFPQYPKALPTPSGLEPENPPRSPSLLDFKPGTPQRAPPSSLSPPLLVAFNTPPPLPPISQLRTQSPGPSARPHLPAGAPPRGPPGRGSDRAVVLEVMSLPTRLQPAPAAASPPLGGAWVRGACWGFRSRPRLFLSRTSPRYCASGSLSVRWETGKVYESCL